jgi:hypothetical protein
MFVAQDLGHDAGHPLQHGLLRFAQLFALIDALQRDRRQDHVADLRQQGGDLDLPFRLNSVLRCQRGHQFTQPAAAAESQGTGHRQDVQQRLDAAVQRLLEKLPFCGDQPVLTDGGVQRHGHQRGRARFGEKAEDPAFVDGRDGVLQVPRAGEQDADGVRCDFAGFGEQRHAVHFRHSQIGDEDRERFALPKQAQCLRPADRSRNFIRPFAQVADHRREQVRFIVYKQNPRGPDLAGRHSASPIGAANCCQEAISALTPRTSAYSRSTGGAASPSAYAIASTLAK